MSIFISRALPFFISPDQHSILGDPLLYLPPVPVVMLQEPFPVLEETEIVASKCEYHQTSPCRLFLTFPSLPFLALAAIVVVVCNMQLILFLFQLAVLGVPELPTFFFSLSEKEVQSHRGKKKGGEKKISLAVVSCLDVLLRPLQKVVTTVF